jgi:hypothetical protein
MARKKPPRIQFFSYRDGQYWFNPREVAIQAAPSPIVPRPGVHPDAVSAAEMGGVFRNPAATAIVARLDFPRGEPCPSLTQYRTRRDEVATEVSEAFKALLVYYSQESYRGSRSYEKAVQAYGRDATTNDLKSCRRRAEKASPVLKKLWGAGVPALSIIPLRFLSNKAARNFAKRFSKGVRGGPNPNAGAKPQSPRVRLEVVIDPYLVRPLKQYQIVSTLDEAATEKIIDDTIGG